MPPRSRWTIYSAWPKSPPSGKSSDFFVGLLNLAVQKNQRCNLPTPYHLTASATAVSRIGRLNRFPRNSDLQRFCRPPSTRDTRKIIIRRVTILSVIVLAKALGLLVFTRPASSVPSKTVEVSNQHIFGCATVVRMLRWGSVAKLCRPAQFLSQLTIKTRPVLWTWGRPFHWVTTVHGRQMSLPRIK